MFEVAIAANPEKAKFVGKGDLSSVTVGFEFEFICKARIWPQLPKLVSENLGPVGEVSKLYGNHQQRDDALTAWHITGDSSIKDYDLGEEDDEPERESGESQEDYDARYDKAQGEEGVELVSPVLKASEALETLNKVLKLLKGIGAKTNHSCSLHVTLGHPRIKDYLDPIKFAVFLGDDKILQRFGRANNRYASSFIRLVQNTLANENAFYDATYDKSRTVDEDEDSWDPDDLEQDIAKTPFETMNQELLSHSVKDPGFINEARKKLLTYLTQFNSGVYADRYHSINLQKVDSNVVEYRAIGSDYLSENPAALSGIVRRVMYALLVAVGDVSSPELDKAYATLLQHKFGAYDVSRTAHLQDYKEPTSKSHNYRFVKEAEIGPDLHLDTTVRVGRLADSLLFSVLFSVMRDNASLLGHTHDLVSISYIWKVPVANGVLSVSYPKDVSVTVTPKAKSGPSPFVTTSEAAKIYSVIKSIVATPTNPYLNDGWKALATTARSAGVGLPEAIDLIKKGRSLVFSPENNKELRVLMAHLVVQHMDPEEVNKRYSDKPNARVATVQSSLKKIALDTAFRSLDYDLDAIRSNYGSDVKDFIIHQVSDPLSTTTLPAPQVNNYPGIVNACVNLIAMGAFANELACATYLAQFAAAQATLDTRTSTIRQIVYWYAYLMSSFTAFGTLIGSFGVFELADMANVYARNAGLMSDEYATALAEHFRQPGNICRFLLSSPEAKLKLVIRLVSYLHKHVYSSAYLGTEEEIRAQRIPLNIAYAESWQQRMTPVLFQEQENR